jgi:ribose transport system permease protein
MSELQTQRPQTERPSSRADVTQRWSDGARRVWTESRPLRPVLILLVVLVVFLCLTQPDFRTWANIQNALTSVSVLWIVAMGMTLVLISGGFDLSVGAIAALAGYFMAKLLAAGVPGGPTLVLTILVGALVGGVINGQLIGRLGLNTFLVTLASMTSIAGVLAIWSNSQSIFLTAPLPTQLAIDKVAGIPVPIWIMVVVFAVALYVQKRTYFGRDIYAVGGSLTASRLSGIKTGKTLVFVYATVGACAGLAGAIAASQSGAATPQIDNTLALQAIAAVLLGGTALTGGVGGVGGTMLGVLFLGFLQNGLSISGVASAWQEVVTGVILVAAVLGGRAGSAADIKSILRRRRSGWSR